MQARRHVEPRSMVQLANLPVYASFRAPDLFDTGLGMVMLARELPGGEELAVSSFLVDTYCLGVKNAFFRILSVSECSQLAEQLFLERIDPACLRKLVEGAVEYAQTLGFRPHPDYATAAQLFGSIETEGCPVRFSYGKDGEPFYVAGPDDGPARTRHIIDTLTRRVGAAGFNSLNAINAQGNGHDSGVSGLIAESGYEVTDEPLHNPIFDRLPSDVQDRINAFYDEIKAPSKQTEATLRAFIRQCPDVTQLYNYLYAVCVQMGEDEEAARVLQETVERFPDYLFGRLAQAEQCLKRGEFEKIPAIFGGKLELGLIYPERTRFHITEAMNFYCVMARYFFATDNLEQAHHYFSLLCEINPEHATTQLVGSILKRSPLKRWLAHKLGLPL